jgi:hypothetical protein
MLKINDRPFKANGNVTHINFDRNDDVVVTLSDPYFITPAVIQVDILQITNKSSIQSMSWSVMPAYEEVLPELVVTQNSVSFEEAYYFGGMVLQLSVLLKNGQYQYYYVPVDLEGIPPFESACEHEGGYLEIHTNQTTVRFDIDGISTGDLDLIGLSGDADLLYEDSTIMLKYYSSLYGVYSNIISIVSNSSNSSYVSKSIKFYPGDEDSYAVYTTLSNFPFIFDEGFTTEVDLSSLPYDYSEYFLATNCCFSQSE